ncbi:cadherin-1-like [Ascaphus truei]|uniref:cadherin-1-like n=1 Tax=Ascaphus truei TaxID=8439 RepID=UPI003F5954C1
MMFSHLVLLIFLIQVTRGLSEQQCDPGFREQRVTFTVSRTVLERGRVLGKVSFDPCPIGSRTLFSPEDTRFRVHPDGMVTVKRPLTLHDGSVNFVINAWDSAGRKHSVTVFVWNGRAQQA